MKEEVSLKKALDLAAIDLQKPEDVIYLCSDKSTEKRVYNVLTKRPQTITEIIERVNSNHKRVNLALYFLASINLCGVVTNKKDRRTIIKFYRKNH